LFNPFRGDLWAAFGIAILVVGLCLWFVEAFPVELENWREEPNDFEARPGVFFVSGVYVMECIMAGGSDVGTVRTWPGRVIVAALLWMALVSVATYTANLASILVVQKTEVLISTHSQLESATVCHVGPTHGDLSHYVGEFQYEPLSDEGISNCMTKLQAGVVDGFVGSVPLLNHVLGESPNCSQLSLSGSVAFAPQHMAFAVKEGIRGWQVEDISGHDDNAYYVDLLSGAIVGIQLNDRLHTIYRRYFEASSCSSSSSSIVITFSEMTGLFVIVGSIAGFALIMRVVETLVRKKNYEPRRRTTTRVQQVVSTEQKRSSDPAEQVVSNEGKKSSDPAEPDRSDKVVPVN